VHPSSLNHQYRLVWSDVTQSFVAVAENTKGRGKQSRSGRAARLVSALMVYGALSTAAAGDLPTGGQIVGGAGSISQSGQVMTINQSSAKMAANWQSFNIGAGNTVNFVQPSASSVALNRVLGSDVSVIQGALNANGQVFLINPNGVLFTPTAQVNVGGLIASTLNLNTADFMAGSYKFEGSSSNAIINQGRITAAGSGSAGGKGGTIALIAAKITNTGTLTANQGNVLLGAGSKVTLDFGGPVKLQVEQGAIDALIEQGGAVRADGGLVYLTAKAAGDLASTVINHTGVTEAKTLATGEKGQIYLLGGMESDRIVVGGKLDASAPNGGNGGFIETSAARVNIADGIQITTAATSGTTGQWLIDPVDITIAASGGNVTGSTLATALQSTSVTLDTAGAGTCTGAACSALTGTSGDIFVNDNINVVNGSADTTLTLKANRDIVMREGQSISRTGGFKLNTVFWADSDATGGGRILTGNANSASSTGTSISSNGGDITLGGGLNLTTGYAKGSNTQSGIAQSGTGVLLAGTALNSGGGNIVIRGEGADSAVVSDRNVHGVWFRGGTNINAGTGMVEIFGKSPSTTGWRNAVITEGNQSVQILSASTSATAIRINGDASTAVTTGVDSCCAYGVFFWNGSLIAATGVGGGIAINGQGGSVSAGTAGGGGLQLEVGSYILANSGPISLTGAKGTGSVYEDIVINGMVGFASSLNWPLDGTASPVIASSSNISLTADSLSNTRIFSGGGAAGAIQSTGTLTIAPRTSGKALSVQTANPGGTGVWINPATMFGVSGLFKAGFTKLVFGSATTGNITLNNYTFDNDTELNTSGNAVLGAATIATKTLAVNMTGSGTITNTGAVAVSKLNLNGSTSAATLANTSNAIGTLAANVASLSLVNSSALSIGTVGATNGVTATGTVDIATLSGDLTVAQNVTTSNTSATAIVLNAGKSTAAGTSTGGHIVLSGSPVISVGSGGSATLMTGSVSGSTGLTALVGSGTGRFRYNSDEVATNYSSALVSGLNAIYREKPVIFNVTPGAATSLYGNAPSVAGVTGTVSTTGSYVNGDTTSTTTGTASFTTTALSTSNVGSYNIAYASGLINSLGYGFADATGSVGEYTINQRPITVTASDQGRSYGSANPTSGTVTVTSGNLVNSNTLSTATVSSSATSTTAAGQTAALTPSAQTFSAGSAGNYAITYTDGTLTIDRRPVTVTADAKAKTVDATDPVLTYTAEAASGVRGLLTGETLSGSLSRVSGENMGSFAIQQGTLTDANNASYALTYIAANLEITRALAPAPSPSPAIITMAQEAARTVVQATAANAATGTIQTPQANLSLPTAPTLKPGNMAPSGGLAFMDVPAEYGGSSANRGSTGGSSGSPQGSTFNDGAGRDISGFMRVFVVGGGINLGGR